MVVLGLSSYHVQYGPLVLALTSARTVHVLVRRYAKTKVTPPHLPGWSQAATLHCRQS